MSEDSVVTEAEPEAGPSALAEPTRPVSTVWITGLTVANLAVWMGF